MWELATIEDTCDILDKLRKPITKSKRIEGPYPYYGATGVLSYVDGYLFDEPLVLIGEDGAKWDVGDKTAFAIDGKTWVNNHAHVLRPNRDKLIDSWLLYFVEATDLAPFITGLTVPKLNQAKLKTIRFPLPTLEEQKRIVGILDEAFAGIDQAIANTEKNLQNARDLFESYLNNIFTQKGDGWVEKKLGDVCDFQNGFAFKSADTVTSSNVQLIRMGNLYQNKLDLERKPSFYPESFSSGYERYELGEGDLIISLTGTVDKEDYGYTVEIPASRKTLLLNQRIAKFIILSDDLRKEYLLYILRSRVFLDQLYASASGTRQANLSTNKMKELIFYLPSVDQQAELIETTQSLDKNTAKLIANGTKKLTALKELKQSLLQKAFAGELTSDKQAAA